MAFVKKLFVLALLVRYVPAGSDVTRKQGQHALLTRVHPLALPTSAGRTGARLLLRGGAGKNRHYMGTRFTDGVNASTSFTVRRMPNACARFRLPPAGAAFAAAGPGAAPLTALARLRHCSNT